jgi:hypothetical protein
MWQNHPFGKDIPVAKPAYKDLEGNSNISLCRNFLLSTGISKPPSIFWRLRFACPYWSGGRFKDLSASWRTEQIFGSLVPIAIQHWFFFSKTKEQDVN